MGILLILIFSGLNFGADASPQKIKAKFEHHTIDIEIAESEESRARGLMFVRSMRDDHGMLFVFPKEFIPTFWMKNTLIPLSIAFIDGKFRIVDIQEMSPPKSMMDLDVPRYTSRRPAILALEMNSTWFKRHGIKEGMELKLLSPAPTPLLRGLQERARPKSK